MTALPAEAGDAILAGLRQLWTPHGVHELRVFDTKRGTVVGYFDNPEAMAAAAAEWDTSPKRGEAPGIYWTINPARSECLLRLTNRVREYAKKGDSIADHDIARRVVIPIDVDVDKSLRPAGISSTDEEQRYTRTTAIQIAKYLRDQGTPLASLAQADSGNGWHVLLFVDLPNDDDSRDLVRRFLYSLDQQFSDGKAKVDVSTFNAARIFKIYGTLVTKGDATLERPHRIARLIQAPQERVACPPAVLRTVANVYQLEPRQPQFGNPGGVRRSYDIESFLARYMQNVRGPEPWRDGARVWYVQCPFKSHHGQGTDTLIGQQADGAVWFDCKHDSCHHNKWAQVRALYDPIPEPTRIEPKRPESGGHPAGESAAVPAQELPPALHPFTDSGNAERLVDRFGDDVRWTNIWQQWHLWSPPRWRLDQVDAIFRYALATIRQAAATEPALYTGKKQEDAQKHFVFSENRGKLDAMIRMAGTHRRIAMLPEQWDNNPWLFNTANGTLDLQTGQFRAAERTDYATMASPVTYDPDATCPQWEQLMLDWMDGNEEKVQFLQEFFGYCLTGDTTEQKLLLLWGEGSNGKGVFLETLTSIIGEYAGRCRPETLMASEREGVGDDLAALAGKRLVSTVETGAGDKIDAKKVKHMTGGDEMTVRFLYGKYFTFRPVWKIVIVTNEEPHITVTDFAMWRRITKVNFNVVVPEARQDIHLRDKLASEQSGILNWLVKGCWHRQERGRLYVPSSVQDEIAAYKADLDSVGQFFEACCERGEGNSVSRRQLYNAFKAWWGIHNGNRAPMSDRAFGKRVKKETGVQEFVHPDSRKRWQMFSGLTLLDGIYEELGEGKEQADLSLPQPEQAGFGDLEGELI